MTANPIQWKKEMTKKELEYYKKRLLEDRKRHLEDIGRGNQELQSGDDEEGDIVDIASASYDKNLLLGILDKVDREQLERIDAALMRIEEGTFGKCIACGKEIDANRLEVMPVSLKCISCKQNEDSMGGTGYAMEPAPPFSSSKGKSTKKTAAKKTTGKKKAVPKKSAVKKPAAKKAAPKKSAAKKPAAKKAAPKKSAVKKAAPKKTAAKKAPVKKTAAKKTGTVKKKK